MNFENLNGNHVQLNSIICLHHKGHFHTLTLQIKEKKDYEQ